MLRASQQTSTVTSAAPDGAAARPAREHGRVKTAEDIIRTCNEEQLRHDRWLFPEKFDAFEAALRMFPDDVDEVVEIGHEEPFRKIYEKLGLRCIGLNLPDDAHYFDVRCKAVLARHVLEHSPIPLLMIANVFESLEDGGHFVAVVPEPIAHWCNWPPHFSVLPHRAWVKLFRFAGFKVLDCQMGTWKRQKQYYEYRFLLQKPAMAEA